MDQRLTKIEKELSEIEPAVFQRLGDEFLYCRFGNEFKYINRSGTQIGKKRSRKGTPDTYVILSNGLYVLIEYTVTEKQLLKKLLGDLDKCLDSDKTSLSLNEIDRIILVFTGRLEIHETKKLKEHCPSLIDLVLINLDVLAMALHNDFNYLARKYLNIPYDSLQLLTPDEFVEEQERKTFNKKNPLSNPFRLRENELVAALEKLNCHDFLLISGNQGVGKTKFAVELIKLFCQQNSSYKPLCITNRFTSLLEDLNDYLREGESYIFLIDDANRQIPVLKQTLEFINAKFKITIKVILTVRDYAYSIANKHLTEYNSTSFSIEKFSDEQIIELIKSPPFDIGNLDYQNRIRDLANGNPRFAVMAAIISNETQDLLAIYDATDLYVAHYQNHKDGENNPILDKPDRMKVLGILAVFRLIDLQDHSLCERICNIFGIERKLLVNELCSLEKDELANVYLTDNLLYRISDQNLSSYAIYYSFINKKLLSLERLFLEFFEEYSEKIRDAFHGMINVFKSDKAIDSIKSEALKYYAIIEIDDEKAFKFLNVFYFILTSETLAYLNDFFSDLIRIKEEWDRKQTHKDLFYRNSAIEGRIRLIFFYLADFNSYFDSACELLIFIVNRYPEQLDSIKLKITDSLAFTSKDHGYVKLRQADFLSILLRRINEGNPGARQLLISSLPFFLNIEYEGTSLRRNAVTWSYFTLPFEEPYIAFRERLWKIFQDLFHDNYNDCLKIFKSYSTKFPRNSNNEYYKYDLNFVDLIVRNYLNPNEFSSCFMVNDYLVFLKNKKIKNLITENLRRYYRNPDYDLFLLLSFDYIKGVKAEKEKWMYPEKFKAKKVLEIQQFLNSSNINNLKGLFEKILKICQLKECENLVFNEAIETILMNFKNNSIDFHSAIKTFSMVNWSNQIWVRVVLHNTLKSIDDNLNLWFDIFSYTSYRINEWKLTFFELLSEESINEKFTFLYMDYYSTHILNGEEINDFFWKKYLRINPRFYTHILKILSHLYDSKGIIYFLRDNFIKDNLPLFDIINDLPLLKKIYIQQLSIRNRHNFDYHHENLKILLEQDPAFILLYVETHYQILEDTFDHPTFSNLSFLLNLINGFQWALEVIELMKTKNRSSTHGDHYEPFFTNAYPQGKEKLSDFLSVLVKEYSSEPMEISAMVRCLHRNQRSDETLLVLTDFLNYNQSFEDFCKINWEPNLLTGGANTNFSQIRADSIKPILGEIHKRANKLSFLKHIKHLERAVGNYEKQAEWERRRMFSRDD